MGETVEPVAASAPPAARRRARVVRRLAARHPFATFVTSLLLFVIVLRLLWGWYVSRQVSARLEQGRRSGEPATLSEIVIEPVADGDNAWLRFVRAATALAPGVDSPRNSMLEYPHYPPFGGPWEKAAEASEKANGRAFQLAREARGMRQAQFRESFDLKSLFALTSYNGARTLANTLADGTTYAHLRGDDAEAVERLLDLLHLGRTLRQDTLLLSQLVAYGVEALALDAAQQMAPTLAIGPRGGSPAAASATQVRAVIDALLDERAAQASLPRTFVHDRAVTFALLDREAAGTRAIRPLADQAKLRRLSDFTRAAEAARQPNYAAAHRLLPKPPETPDTVGLPNWLAAGTESEIPRYSRWFADHGSGGLRRVIEHYHRLSAERRATAVAFAVRLFRVDHGHWPDSLAQLVPTYLPAVPTDPFRDDGRTLGYVLHRGVLPGGGDRPLVYFEPGGNGTAALDPEPMFGWQSGHGEGRRLDLDRQYRDLNLWLPTTRRFDEEQKRLAEEAVDYEPYEPDAPGDDVEDEGEPDVPAEE